MQVLPLEKYVKNGASVWHGFLKEMFKTWLSECPWLQEWRFQASLTSDLLHRDIPVVHWSELSRVSPCLPMSIEYPMVHTGIHGENPLDTHWMSISYRMLSLFIVMGEYPCNIHCIAIKFPWNVHWISIEIPFEFLWNSIRFPLNFHSVSIEFPFNVHRISVEFQVNFHWISTEIPLNIR